MILKQSPSICTLVAVRGSWGRGSDMSMRFFLELPSFACSEPRCFTMLCNPLGAEATSDSGYAPCTDDHSQGRDRGRWHAKRKRVCASACTAALLLMETLYVISVATQMRKQVRNPTLANNLKSTPGPVPTSSKSNSMLFACSGGTAF